MTNVRKVLLGAGVIGAGAAVVWTILGWLDPDLPGDGDPVFYDKPLTRDPWMPPEGL